MYDSLDKIKSCGGEIILEWEKINILNITSISWMHVMFSWTRDFITYG